MNLIQRIFSHLDEIHTPRVQRRTFQPQFDGDVLPPRETPMENPLTSINADITLTAPAEAVHSFETDPQTDALLQDAIDRVCATEPTRPEFPIKTAIVEATSPSVLTEATEMAKPTTPECAEGSEARTTLTQGGRVLMELDLSPEECQNLVLNALSLRQEIMTMEEVASLLRLETHEVGQLTYSGTLLGFVAGPYLRYRRDDVHAFIANGLEQMTLETQQRDVA